MSLSFLEQRCRPLDTTFVDYKEKDIEWNLSDLPHDSIFLNKYRPSRLRRRHSIGGYIPFELKALTKSFSADDCTDNHDVFSRVISESGSELDFHPTPDRHRFHHRSATLHRFSRLPPLDVSDEEAQQAKAGETSSSYTEAWPDTDDEHCEDASRSHSHAASKISGQESTSEAPMLPFAASKVASNQADIADERPRSVASSPTAGTFSGDWGASPFFRHSAPAPSNQPQMMFCTVHQSPPSGYSEQAVFMPSPSTPSAMIALSPVRSASKDYSNSSLPVIPQLPQFTSTSSLRFSTDSIWSAQATKELQNNRNINLDASATQWTAHTSISSQMMAVNYCTTPKAHAESSPTNAGSCSHQGQQEHRTPQGNRKASINLCAVIPAPTQDAMSSIITCIPMTRLPDAGSMNCKTPFSSPSNFQRQAPVLPYQALTRTPTCIYPAFAPSISSARQPSPDSFSETAIPKHQDRVGGVTTLMIRNLPRELTQAQLLEELDSSGFGDLYDFVYMPGTFDSREGKGYAFVNLVSTGAAGALIGAWHRSRRCGVPDDCPALNISPAALQGLDANVQKWAAPRMNRIRNPGLRPFVRGSSLLDDNDDNCTSPKRTKNAEVLSGSMTSTCSNKINANATLSTCAGSLTPSSSRVSNEVDGTISLGDSISSYNTTLEAPLSNKPPNAADLKLESALISSPPGNLKAKYPSLLGRPREDGQEDDVADNDAKEERLTFSIDLLSPMTPSASPLPNKVRSSPLTNLSSVLVLASPQSEKGASERLAPGVTTLMIRNLPKDVTQPQLLAELDMSGFADLYDFAYLPGCFDSREGKGYAFVNMTSASAAGALIGAWHRSRRCGVADQAPPLNISPAALQGLEANVQKWAAPRMHRIRNPGLRPFLRDTSLCQES